MEPEGGIPLGTFIELTWHRAGPEPDEIWDGRGDNRDGESAEFLGVVSDEPARSDVIRIDAAWKALDYLND